MSSYYFHENFSLTRALTGLTNAWYQESIKCSNYWGPFLLGRFGSRLVNLLILPTSLADSIAHVAMAVFTVCAGIPLGLLYNARQWFLGLEGQSRFTLSGAIINLMNAKKHFPCGYLGVIVGILNPEADVHFF